MVWGLGPNSYDTTREVSTKNAGWNQENVILMSELVNLTSKDKRAESQSIDTEKRILIPVRPDMRYCFRSGRFLPNPRTKHISVPLRHMTKSYIPDFNMISQHYRYKDTTSHTIGIQVPEYNTSTEDTF